MYRSINSAKLEGMLRRGHLFGGTWDEMLFQSSDENRIEVTEAVLRASQFYVSRGFSYLEDVRVALESTRHALLSSRQVISRSDQLLREINRAFPFSGAESESEKAIDSSEGFENV